jgi:glycosyltransferase involved in cell wall biosynthesis
MRRNVQRLKLSVIAPVFNEEQGIEHFHARTKMVLEGLADIDAKILYVVDRCTDNTVSVLRNLVQSDSCADMITMSSRFGHQMSLMAGIENALDADVLVMMDSDLQHPPELIPVLLNKFHEGFDVVYTTRRDTEKINFFRKSAGNLFYIILGKLTQIPINANAADFRLISNRVARILANDFKERNMFLRGLFSWIGFSQTAVEYVAEKRFAGYSKYSFSRMVQLAMVGILSFSTKPLQLGIFVGVGFSLLSFLLISVEVVRYFIVQSLPDGWATLVVLLLLFSGIQLIVLGIIGAYIGGIYEEVKCRPRYIIDDRVESKGNKLG